MRTINKTNATASPPPRPSGRFCSGAAALAVFAAMLLAARSAVAPQVQVLRVARLPRVYNALVTSEQRLLPSQADPIVAPVFRPFPAVLGYHGWPYAVSAAAVVDPVPLLSAGDAAVEAVTADASTEVRSVVAVAGGGGGGDDDASREQRPPVKNNRPADASVPDVPPPPLPVSRVAAGEKDAAKKKPEEYPPAPGGFAI